MEHEKLEPKLKELGLLGKRSCFGDKLISPQLLDEFYAKVIKYPTPYCITHETHGPHFRSLGHLSA